MASVEEILASMPETYYACVVGTMVNLEKLIKNDRKTEITILLQDPEILEMWMLVESNIADIEKGKELSKQKGQEAYLNYLLMVRDISQRYKELGNRYLKAFTDVINQYDGWIIGDWITDEGVDFYLEQGYSLEGYDISRDFLHEINKQSLNARGETYGALSKIQRVIFSVIASGHNALKSIVPDDKELKELTTNFIRDYCKTFYTQKFQANLRHEAVRLMGGEKYTRVTPENWIDLLTNEDKLIELGKGRLALIEYQNSKADDARFEFYGEDRCKILDDSNDLMDIMLRVNYGLELFDLQVALDSYNLLSALNENNLFLFSEMFLRRNVMLGMIEPLLKDKFERWIKGGEERTDSATATTDSTRTEAEEFSTDSLIRFVFDDNDREKVIKGLKACKDSGQVATFARRLWVEEVIEPDVLRSVEFHRAVIPLLKFDMSETALKQAIIKQITTN